MVDIERLRSLMVAADPFPTSASWDVNALRVLLRHGSASVSGRRAYPNERLDRDAALIAAVVNALPDLLGELAMLRELRDATFAMEDVESYMCLGDESCSTEAPDPEAPSDPCAKHTAQANAVSERLTAAIAACRQVKEAPNADR